MELRKKETAMTDLQAIVEEIHTSLSPRRGEGKVADYIPQLAHVDPHKFGMAVVTVDGETRPLPEPFFVIATQNPSTQIGTFPLPESQLDRFLLRVELGYPDRAAERALLESGGRRDALPALAACLAPEQIVPLQQAAGGVHVAPALLDYVQALVEATRTSPRFVHGLRPRAALALLAVARAWAFLAGRRMVMPEDVQAVLPSVACHRLQLADGNGHAGAEDIAGLIRSIPVT